MKYQPQLRTIQNIVEDSFPTSKFANLNRQAEVLHQLQELINQFLSLPNSLANSCRVAKYSQNKLSLLIDLPELAYKLRFQIPQLLSELRQHPQFSGISNIQLKIAKPGESSSPLPPATAKKTTMRTNLINQQISPDNKQTALDNIQNISDAQLRTSLLKLLNKY